MQKELAIPGTHSVVVNLVCRLVNPGGRALDLGSGLGALAEHLRARGFDVMAVDIVRAESNTVPFIELDLNEQCFHNYLPCRFDIITAVEVIEHLESPIAFLKSVAHLLKPHGIAVVTTPNVENIPSRFKFCLTGKLRGFETRRDHISPVFYDLFVREFLPRAGLRLIEHFVYPEDDYVLTGRRWLVPFMKLLTYLVRGPTVLGDSHIFVLTGV